LITLGIEVGPLRVKLVLIIVSKAGLQDLIARMRRHGWVVGLQDCFGRVTLLCCAIQRCHLLLAGLDLLLLRLDVFLLLKEGEGGVRRECRRDEREENRDGEEE
jgi:hypothetical protein